MLKFLFIFISSVFSLSLEASPTLFDSPQKLGELKQTEQMYFQPKDKNSILNWTGLIYHYGLNKCYELTQKENSNQVNAKEIQCPSAFLKKAKEPYAKISDFKKYESRILKCLETSDQACLRGLISKNLQISFGVDVLQDRRDYIFENWKKEDFKRLHYLIKKGSIGSADRKAFPPEPSDDGTGYRGEFIKENDGWILKSFVAGD